MGKRPRTANTKLCDNFKIENKSAYFSAIAFSMQMHGLIKRIGLHSKGIKIFPRDVLPPCRGLRA